jgi:hypothetical protein
MEYNFYYKILSNYYLVRFPERKLIIVSKNYWGPYTHGHQ